GVLYVHRHLLLPLATEDATGLALVHDGLLWCVQTQPFNTIKEVRRGILRSTPLSSQPLDLHDVAAGPDGIYAVCTETNEVVHLDEGYRVLERWSFGAESDSAHVNCIAWFQGRLLASLFGSFVAHREYKGCTRSAGRVIDVRSGTPLIEGLSQPHSLVVAGEELWLCSSEDRSVEVYDSVFRRKRQLRLPGYTRGLAVGDACVYVGISRSRNAQEVEPGEFTSAVIAVLDRASLAVIGYMPMPCNEIYDIRIAPSVELVTDVMASLWARERAEQPKLIEAATRAVQRDAEDRLEQVSMLLREEQRDAEDRLEQVSELLHKAKRDIAQGVLNEAALRNDLAGMTQLHAAELDARRSSEAAMEGMQASLQRAERNLTMTKHELASRDGTIQSAEREISQITASRYWRWTWPVRAAMQLLRGHGLIGRWDRQLAGRARQQVRRLRGRALKPTVAEPTGPRLAPAEVDRCDVFVWAIIDWDYRTQRPQHLARELADRGHRVFYISNNFVDHAEAGFRVDPLDEHGRLFRVQLHLSGAPGIYYGVPDMSAQSQLCDSVGHLLAWTRTRASLSLVQHPYWRETARILPNQRLVYDCMDHHGGFLSNSDEVLAWEHELMCVADLLVVTSEWLYEEAGKYNPRRWMVRNACQYEHFATPPKTVFADEQGRAIIGYFGAIAEWMDLDLLEKLAQRFAGHLILLVGTDTAGARARLRHLDNVMFTDEVPYANLPFYLAAFDVCLLPFQVIPLTLATNPVKVYEYLSAGKDVVSIALPEMHQFGTLIRTAPDHASFLDAVADALRHPADATQVTARQAFAIEQTWAHRVQELLRGVDMLPQPRVSVIVVTYNNSAFTKACLRSLELYSDYTNLETIVVDNASTDDTRAYLAAWMLAGPQRRVLLNAKNLGFAAANNQGLAAASGEYLVLLNNDTYVTPGWIATLLAHLHRCDTLGVIGPVTNNIGNEARIDIHYASMEEMVQVAADYTLRHVGKRTPLRTAAFFCVMLRRVVYEQVGPLDEAFGLGFFEDDDYCRRAEHAGWDIACAEDVFIHHHLSASFSKLKQDARQTLFVKNKALYEAKWGEWIPHKYRYG
ncbi:glycosyltransferase, partial [Dyella sp.]|uniref:glycosyltransferase n=1 Tax=Dyella sp. TaxID=1869338 RepID=UPI002BD2A2A6